MEMLFCSTVVGLPFLIPPMLFTGELFKAWTSCAQVNFGINSTFFPQYYFSILLSSKQNHLFLSLQHPYVYGVLVFEAMATFIGQVSVLSLIAIFGAATTAMVNCYHIKLSLLLIICQFGPLCSA